MWLPTVQPCSPLLSTQLCFSQADLIIIPQTGLCPLQFTPTHHLPPEQPPFQIPSTVEAQFMLHFLWEALQPRVCSLSPAPRGREQGGVLSTSKGSQSDRLLCGTF